MDVPNVAPKYDAGVIEKRGSIELLDGLEVVKQTGEKLALNDVAFLRGFETFARAVMTHVVRPDLDAEARQQRADRLTIGHHARAIGPKRRDDQLVHKPDFLDAREA